MNEMNELNGKLTEIITDSKIINALREKYDIINDFHEGLAAVHKIDDSLITSFGKEWGFINTHGDLVIPIKYEEVTDFKDGLSEVVLHDYFSEKETKVINKLGETEHTIKGKRLFLPFDTVETFNDLLFKASTDDKWGLIDPNGIVILPAIFDGIALPQDGISLVNKGIFEESIGYILENGEILIPPEYESINLIDDKIAIVGKKRSSYSLNLKFALFDMHVNKQVTSAFFDKIDSIGNGLFKVVINNLKNDGCTINSKGEVQIQNSEGDSIFLPYEFIEKRSDGYFAVLKNNSWGILDSGYNIIVNPEYDNIELFKKSHFVVQKHFYEEVTNGFSHKEKLVVKNGIVDKFGKLVVPCTYDLVDLIGHDKARFKIIPKNDNNTEKELKEVKFGLIEIIDGKIIQEQKYDEIEEYISGLSLFKIENKNGYFDQNGNVLIGTLFDYATKFNGSSLAIASLNSSYGIINNKGESIVPYKFEDIKGLSEHGTFIAKENGLYGLFNIEGYCFIKPKYKDLNRLTNVLYSATLNGKTGCINEAETVIIAYDFIFFIYDHIENEIIGNFFLEDENYTLLIYFDLQGNEIKREENYKDYDSDMDEYVDYYYINDEPDECGACGEAPCRCSDPF